VCRNTWHIASVRNGAGTAVCSYGRCGGRRPPLDERPGHVPPKIVDTPTQDRGIPQGSVGAGVPPWDGFDKFDEPTLSQQSISNLRKYAAHDLHIRGASKIRGGKAALISRILQVRMAS